MLKAGTGPLMAHVSEVRHLLLNCSTEVWCSEPALPVLKGGPPPADSAWNSQQWPWQWQRSNLAAKQLMLCALSALM